MSLEEKLRAYAAKGELVHLSLAFSNGEYHARFANASPAGGYASGCGGDPVDAIEKAFKASPAKPARVSKAFRGVDEVTAAVIDQGSGLPSTWTNP